MDCPIPLRPIQLSTDYYTSERSNGIGNCGSLYSPFDKDVKMDANAKRDRLTTIQPIATTTTSINTSFVNETALPAEILLEIFKYVSDCQSTLYNMSLVCKQWFYCATPILYSHPKMTDTLSWANFILALTRKKKSFIYGDFVKSIDISKECSMGKSTKRSRTIRHSCL
ncbi:hypothetical protein BDF20DRAFT_851541 [Mycotypha africana]|uniref:uncharacterized protein n=1 Tax=Mycotypha africana TaxID=64632 RepID=UPI002300DDA2|nr:uncharacterized protein BDF20DRAFT_851541 [Mycotypha africana]KAI8987666.1 hypothetical protein BDF20DRAFT_851541 [Mycotypha africana]